MENADLSDPEVPSPWVVFIALAILGLLAGSVSVVLLELITTWLSQFLPLQQPWPSSYYAKVDYAELAVISLIDAGFFMILRRQSLIFAVAFAVSAICLILFVAFLTAMGFDGSWYIP